MKKISILIILIFASFNIIFGCEDQLQIKIINDFNEFGTYMKKEIEILLYIYIEQQNG